MVTSAPSLVKKLQRELDSVATAKTRDWFNAYLKGAIEYRGVKTPTVITIVKQWWSTNSLGDRPESEQFEIALLLLQQYYAEDKFAGAIVIERYLLNKIPAKEQLQAYKQLFSKGYFGDWSTTDWFCVRVLDPLITLSGLESGKEIARWSTAQDLWQRRSSAVALRGVAENASFHVLIEKTIAKLVKEEERFIQTGIGWLLAELSRSHPRKAEEIFRRHLALLSREVIDRHSKHLKCHCELKALKRGQARPSAWVRKRR